MSKANCTRLFNCVLIVAISSALHLQAQTLTNKGTLIYVSPKAVFSCNGTMNVNSAGMVVVEDSATFTVRGTLNISNGSLSLNNTSTATVTQDLVTGGVCGAPTGTVIRNGPGVLTVQGFVNNKGLITNNSLIRIIRDLNNDGDLNNQSGSVIDIGP